MGNFAMLAWCLAWSQVPRFRSTKAELESRIETVRLLYESITNRSNLVKIAADAFGCTRQQVRTYVRIVEERYGGRVMTSKNVDKSRKVVQLYDSEPTEEMKQIAWKEVRKKISTKTWPSASIFKCTDCLGQATEYHHPNYFFPLWIEPVCKACHVRLHVISRQSKVRPKTICS